VAPDAVLKLLSVLVAGSVAVECGVLSGLWPLPVGVYHVIHLLLMATLLAAMLALHRHRRSLGAADSAVPLWFAAGLAFTGIGDYVNSALSAVDPVTPKLNWALLFFALGYSCYVVGMWKGTALLTGGRTDVSRALWLLLPVILVMNVITWITRVYGLVAAHPILTWGSFVFNATLYVLLPWLGIRYLVARRFSVDAVVVMVGVAFIIYSDLVLFDSWMKLAEGKPIPTALYAANWILYFGGQCLTNVFPPSLAKALDGTRESYSAATP
jgi:hypothetical protein